MSRVRSAYLIQFLYRSKSINVIYGGNKYKYASVGLQSKIRSLLNTCFKVPSFKLQKNKGRKNSYKRL